MTIQAATIAQRPRSTVPCAECGQSFTFDGRKTTFCSSPCKTAFQNRQLGRGRALVAMAQAWRLGRHTKNPSAKAAASFAFEQLAALADVYNREDAAAGRPSALAYIAQLKASGRRPSVDRQR